MALRFANAEYLRLAIASLCVGCGLRTLSCSISRFLACTSGFRAWMAYATQKTYAESWNSAVVTKDLRSSSLA